MMRMMESQIDVRLSPDAQAKYRSGFACASGFYTSVYRGWSQQLLQAHCRQGNLGDCGGVGM
jgi:hypothetical protein